MQRSASSRIFKVRGFRNRLARQARQRGYTAGIKQCGSNIVWFQKRKLFEQLNLTSPGRKPAYNLLDRHTQPANRRLPAHNGGVGGDALQKFIVMLHVAA